MTPNIRQVWKEVESHSCSIRGETYRFQVLSAAPLEDRPDQTAFQIAVFRRQGAGDALAATIRATGEFRELERLPTALNHVVEQVLLGLSKCAETVH